MTYLWMTHKRLTEDTAFVDLITRLPESELPMSWTVANMQRLPLFQAIYKTISLTTGQFFRSLERDDLDDPLNPILVFPTYSLAGQSSYRSIQSEQVVSSSLQSLKVIFLDLRIIYEALAIFAVSPIGGVSLDDKRAVAYTKLALATRLGKDANVTQLRIALGLTATSFIQMTQGDPRRYPPQTLAELLEHASLSERNVEVLLSVLVNRILFHEFAHLYFERSQFEENTYRGWVENTICSLRSTPEVLHKFDREVAERAASIKVELPGVPSFADVLRRLDANADEEDIFRQLDIEEIMCDTFSVSHILFHLKVQGLLDTATARLTRQVISLLDVLNNNLIFRLPIYKAVSSIISKYDRDDATAEERQSYRAQAIEAVANGMRRTSLILSGRRFITEMWFDGSVTLHAPASDGQTPTIDLPALFDKTLYENFPQFLMSLEDRLEAEASGFRTLMELSSTGRGVSLFFNQRHSEREVGLRADPFSFYVFGFSFGL
jgi:hypothetical protein